MRIRADELRDKIEKRGIKKKCIADALEISTKCLHNKLNDKTQFLPTEIAKLTEILGLTNKEMIYIFFPTL